jgi:elongation factor P
MATISDITKGLIIKFEESLYEIIEFLHVKPGKGQAFVRTKMKDLENGATITKSFKKGDTFDIVSLEEKEAQFLYKNKNEFYFMDLETYEQLTIDENLISEARDYLKENMQCKIRIAENKVIGVVLPNFVTLKITSTEPGVRGNTVQGGGKPAILETGARVKVPLFLKEGEEIVIDTRTGEYIESIGYEKQLKSGEILFKEGDRGDEMYLIRAGKIRIVKDLEGISKTLAVIGEGEFFGEMALLDKSPRSATAIAETDAKLIIVDRDAFLSSVNRNPFIKYIIETLTNRLRKTNNMLKYFSVPNEKIRVLLFLKDRLSKNKQGDMNTGLDAGGREIADLTGVPLDEVKEYLKELKEYNIVNLEETVVIKSTEKFEKYEEYIILQEEFKRK